MKVLNYCIRIAKSPLLKGFYFVKPVRNETKHEVLKPVEYNIRAFHLLSLNLASLGDSCCAGSDTVICTTSISTVHVAVVIILILRTC